jgi:hypothetical protein
MTMIHVSNCKLKIVFMCLFCLGLLLIFSGPGMAAGLNLASSVGTAEITWSPAAAPVCIGDDGFDKIQWQEKNSFSSAWSGVNGKDTGPGQSDYFEDTLDTHVFPIDSAPFDPLPFPSWRATYFKAPFFGFSGSAIGIADTNSIRPPVPVPVGLGQFPGIANRNFASSDVRLNKFGDADVFIAQSVLEGIFQVSKPCVFKVSGNYTLTQDLKSLLGFAAYSDVAVSFTLYNMNVDLSNPAGTNDSSIIASTLDPGGDPPVNPFYVAPLEDVAKGFWKNPPFVSKPGKLTLDGIILQATDGYGAIWYDFEAAASTVASAAAPSKPIFFPWGWWWLNSCRGQWN